MDSAKVSDDPRSINQDIDETLQTVITNVARTLSAQIMNELKQQLPTLAQTTQPNQQEMQQLLESDLKTMHSKLAELIQQILLLHRQDIVNQGTQVFPKSMQDLRNKVLQALHEKFINEKRWHRTLEFGEILPPDIKFFDCDGTQALIFIEKPPQVQTVTFNANFLSDAYNKMKDWDPLRAQADPRGPGTFQLAMPWTIYVIYIRLTTNDLYGMGTFFRNSPLTSLDDSLLMPALPNIFTFRDGFESYTHCLGTLQNLAAKQFHQMPLAQWTEWLIKTFWRSTFTLELPGCWNQSRTLDPRLESPWHWQVASANDPNFVLTIPWIDEGITIRQICDETFGRTNERELNTYFTQVFDDAIKVLSCNTMDELNNCLKLLPNSSQYLYRIHTSLASEARETYVLVSSEIRKLVLRTVEETLKNQEVRKKFQAQIHKILVKEKPNLWARLKRFFS